MPDPERPHRVQVAISAEQLAQIEAFKQSEQLASRGETLRLLLEIALDAVSSGGKRFWDRQPERMADTPNSGTGANPEPKTRTS